MIGKLKGVVDTLDMDHLLLDVGGVGYHVFISGKTRAQLIPGASCSLLIETVLKGELPQLFGFCHALEREWFRLLLSVQGVGSRMALSLLSTFSPEELSLCLYSQDKNQLQRAEGVGPKLALRLLTELKDKSLSLKQSSYSQVPLSDKFSSSSLSSEPKKENQNHAEDIFLALENLGYRRSESAPAIAQALQQAGEDPSLAHLLKTVLSLLAKPISSSL